MSLATNPSLGKTVQASPVISLQKPKLAGIMEIPWEAKRLITSYFYSIINITTYIYMGCRPPKQKSQSHITIIVM